MEIKRCRLNTGMRQEDLATKLQIDRSTVAKWESGEAMPRADKLPELARVLGCSIDDLFRDSPEPEQTSA